ncbi:MAG: efflux RND transporter periplasmic adaptor subunit [Desulfococcaceae bacterium]
MIPTRQPARRLRTFGLIGALLLATAIPVRAEQFPVVVEAEERAVLSAEREGVLVELNVGVGDTVNRGDILARVFHDDLVLQKELHQATREYLEIQVKNLERLGERGMTTEEELARARMDLAVNGKEIDLVENRVVRSRLRAPFSGIVLERKVEPHEWVQPGQPVLELYNPRELRIVGDIPADLALGMEKGREYRFEFPDIQGEAVGRIRVLSPQINVRSNTVKVYWDVPEGDRKLLPGMKGVLKFGVE